MQAKTLLTTAAAFTLFCVAVSALYFVFVYTPKHERLRAETAAQAAEIRLDRDCAGQADRLADRMRQWHRWAPSFIADSRSHYNRKLRKCFVRPSQLNPRCSHACFSLTAMKIRQCYGGAIQVSVDPAYATKAVTKVTVWCWIAMKPKRGSIP